MSEWVTCKFFREKKTKCFQIFWEKKKKHLQNLKTCFFFACFLPFFWGNHFFGKWVACKLFLGKKKKNSCFFFFPKKGKKISENEWVSERWTLPGKIKKYGTFGRANGKIIFCIIWTFFFSEFPTEGWAPGATGALGIELGPEMWITRIILKFFHDIIEIKIQTPHWFCLEVSRGCGKIIFV